MRCLSNKAVYVSDVIERKHKKRRINQLKICFPIAIHYAELSFLFNAYLYYVNKESQKPLEVIIHANEIESIHILLCTVHYSY